MLGVATEHLALLEMIHDELIDVVGLCDMHAIAEELKLPQIPKTHVVMERIRKAGFTVVSTHFRPTAFKTDMPVAELKKLIKKIKKLDIEIFDIR